MSPLRGSDRSARRPRRTTATRRPSSRSFAAFTLAALTPLAVLHALAGPPAVASPAICASMTQPVHQSINPTTNASLLTTNTAEVPIAAKSSGFTTLRGQVFKAGAAPTQGLTPIYRMFKAGNFMLLPNLPGVDEFELVQTRFGYQRHNVEFYASTTPLACGLEVRRFFNGSKHRFTASVTEGQALQRSGWADEGVRFWVSSLASGNPTPAPSPAPSASPSQVPSTVPTAAPPTQAPTPTIAPTPAPPTPTPPAPVPTTPPAPPQNSGDQVQWANIAKPGESINTVLAKPELTGKILKLPAGVFEVSNFRDPSVAIRIPKTVKGVVGAGRDTILRIKPYTSTFAATVPAQSTRQTNQLYVLRMNDGLSPQILSDLWVQGTPQNHTYNGVMVGNSKPGTTVEDVLITGMDGNAGTPPGETFGLNWWRGSGSVTRNVEVDGYQWSGDSYGSRKAGPKVGASPIGYNSHDDARMYDVFTHDAAHGMPTFWQSNNAQTWNLQSVRNSIGINHEESFGIVHHQPVMWGSTHRRHVNFMSARGDGTLTIIGATNDEWLNTTTSGSIGKGKKLLVLTPTNYTGPNTNRISTPPKILHDNGTPAPWLWAH